MAIELVREYLKTYGREQDIIELDTSSATVELAAAALGTEPAHIANQCLLWGVMEHSSWYVQAIQRSIIISLRNVLE